MPNDQHDDQTPLPLVDDEMANGIAADVDEALGPDADERTDPGLMGQLVETWRCGCGGTVIQRRTATFFEADAVPAAW
jgi:hypothetical protein